MHPVRLSRRQFTASVGSSLAAFALTPSLLASYRRRAPFFEWKELRPGMHAGFGQGGNSGLLQSKAGAVLIDAKNAPYGATLRREAEALGKPLSLLINTHHHADHTGGNHAFGESQGVGIIMHPKATPRVEKQVENYAAQMKRAMDAIDSLDEDVPQAALEEIKAAGERADGLKSTDFAPETPSDEAMFNGAEVFLGDVTFTMTHVGPGHTDNDVFVFVEEHNVLHTGDLLFHNRHPYMDASAGVNSAGWIKSCQAMVELCNDETIVIPGHGEITDVDGIRQQIRYFESVRAAAAEAIAGDTSREEFVKVDLPVYKGYGGARLKQRSHGTIYDEMVKENGG